MNKGNEMDNFATQEVMDIIAGVIALADDDLGKHYKEDTSEDWKDAEYDLVGMAEMVQARLIKAGWTPPHGPIEGGK